MSEPPQLNSAADGWADARTTFQRVYDVLVGTRSFLTAAEFADRAECSANGARSALEQLAEMGIATRRNARPAQYRRNDAYLTWKRVESLARDHSAEELRDRLEGLLEEDGDLQDRFGVPAPDAVVTDDGVDHATIHDRWSTLSEWRSIRRDIRVLQRAESGARETAST